ncbi:hypothetical protein AURANDRAFT_52981 [Aureococcus anophagefferens]|uniref:Phosphoglycerate mutase n=1 Tax=Aureococcus anophagefferens TaxID=44056 RepID=F0Y358_AURAN|nr:hypothetical protein AURANDRAFT_52981 [Aureococcus anophagefferens]EGB10307.1 hypothetical protein AURANDRAFT_52981 [Aureococcus anophagefferens]|eukprot:XP_009035114.1 hypothetical protein AURANDRAFT_52981 [Aureococcus anophagefferens]
MRSRAALRPLRRALDAPQREIGTLILLRHGQSIWNGTTATFTGWCDVALTPRGRSQAIEAGELLGERGYGSKITDVFTSELERAYETAALAMTAIEQHGGHRNPRTVRDPRLNERHYGCVQSVCKGDAMLLSYFGEAQVKSWRRSMRGKPPPLDESHPHWRPPPAPATESLADCQARVLACYEDCVKPALFAGPDRTVLLVAHSNTLRGLMASIDGVPDADVPSLHVPNSVPILYRFDETSRELVSRKYAPLEKGSAAGSHARWLLSSRNLIRLRSALAPGGVLTRALFDALDENGDRMLTADEIKLGVRKLLGDDVAVAAIVKRIVRHLNMKDDAVCTLADFEASAAHIAHEILHEAKVPARPPPPEDVDLPWGKVQPIHQRDGGDDRSAYG